MEPYAHAQVSFFVTYIVISSSELTSMNTFKSNKGKQRTDLQINVLNEMEEK